MVVLQALSLSMSPDIFILRSYFIPREKGLNIKSPDMTPDNLIENVCVLLVPYQCLAYSCNLYGWLLCSVHKRLSRLIPV